MESIVSVTEMVFPKTPRYPALPVCPACGANMVELRSFWRCDRCSFTICEECDSKNGED